MSANVDIMSQKHANVLLAPLEAVAFPGNSGEVTVLTAGGKQEKRKVTVGLRSDTDAEILSGLQPGEKLVPPKIDGSDRRKININGGPGGD